MKNTCVQLRVFKGLEAYSKEGKLISDSQPMKINYGGLEWANLVKTASKMGWSKMEAVSLYNTKTGETTKPTDEFKAEVDLILNPKKVVKVTPEQRIAELEAKLEALAKASTDPAITEQPIIEESTATPEQAAATDNGKEALEAARIEWHVAFGKKPNHMKKVETLLAEIEAKKLETK